MVRSKKQQVLIVSNDRGITAIETAFVLLSFMTLTLGLIHIFDLFSLITASEYVTNSVARQASYITNIDRDVRGKAVDSIDCIMQREAAFRVNKYAEEILEITPQLKPLPIRMSSTTVASSPCFDGSETFTVAVIRPGETYEVDDGGTTLVIDHPTLSGITGVPNGAPKELLKSHPIATAMYFKDLGIFGTQDSHLEVATASRQDVPQAVFGEVHDTNGTLVRYTGPQPPTPPGITGGDYEDPVEQPLPAKASEMHWLDCWAHQGTFGSQMALYGQIKGSCPGTGVHPIMSDYCIPCYGPGAQ